MAKQLFENLAEKLFGDKRDQRHALREAGFADEADAEAWGKSIIGRPVEASTELLDLRILRQAKPELTLSTASFILDRIKLQQRN